MRGLAHVYWENTNTVKTTQAWPKADRRDSAMLEIWWCFTGHDETVKCYYVIPKYLPIPNPMLIKLLLFQDDYKWSFRRWWWPLKRHPLLSVFLICWKPHQPHSFITIWIVQDVSVNGQKRQKYIRPWTKIKLAHSERIQPSGFMTSSVTCLPLTNEM